MRRVRHPGGGLRPLRAAVALALLASGVPAQGGEGEAPRAYVVQPGDTLVAIAARHGVRFDALVEANDLADPDAIRAGASLRIPQPGPGAPAAATPPVSAAPPSLWPAHQHADVLLARAERKLAEARFEEALALTRQARALLAPIARTRRARPRLAELEVSAATVHVAMAHRDQALACFRRALAADPRLELDPQATPPKVLRAFRAAREPGAE